MPPDIWYLPDGQLVCTLLPLGQKVPGEQSSTGAVEFAGQ